MRHPCSGHRMKSDRKVDILFSFYKKYRHGLLISSYAVFYLLVFRVLEARPAHGFHIIHTVFDDFIPFCELFIVPYFLWFPYMFLAVFYFVFLNRDKREYYQLAFNLMMGMTAFIIISYVYPNSLQLRPTEFARDNIFVDDVKYLYSIDTPTNVLPSIHVFNSLAIHMAINSCDSLKKHPWIQRASLILTVLIVLSTMFLKQHSFVDVSMGSTLAYAGYLIFYREHQAADTRVSERTGYSHRRNRRRTAHF